MVKGAIVGLAVIGMAGGLGARAATGAVLRVAAGETIQEGIARAAFGDTVRVAPGTYAEDLRLPGGVHLESEGGWTRTRIVGTGEGSVILCEGSGDRTLAGFTVSGGPASDAAIKALMLQEGFLVVRDCRIAENRGDGIAATIYAEMSGFTAENNIIDGNEGRGIAIDVGFSRARLDGNRVIDNHRGGVWIVAADEGELTVARNEIADNLAEDGAGIAGEVSGGAVVRLVANRVIWNRARRAAGVGFTVAGGTLDLWTNDVHGNLAFDAFGGVRVGAGAGAAVALINNTVVGNADGGLGGGVTVETAAEATARIVNCVLWGNTLPDLQGATATHSIVGTGDTAGEGNMRTAPDFIDPENGDYRLCPRSPGVDAGETTAVPEFLAIDAEGAERRVGAAVDCGAYETMSTGMRLSRLEARIDDLATARQLSGRLRSTLQTRLGLVRTALRSRYRWRVSGALSYLNAMAHDVRREFGRGASNEAAGALLPAITATAHQVERCGG